MRRLVASPLVWLGNLCFRTYIRLLGQEGAASVLIGTLEWLRWWADANGLDFAAAVVSSRRRAKGDWEEFKASKDGEA